MRRRVLQFGLLAGLMGLCLGRGTTAQAAVIEQLDVPFSGTIIGCVGEPVSVSGMSHIVVQVTFDSGGGALFGVHDNWHDVTGVGLNTGTTYRGTSAGNSTSFSGQGTVVLTSESDVQLIGQGSAPNFVMRVLVHTTILADGTITSSVDDFDCNAP